MDRDLDAKFAQIRARIFTLCEMADYVEHKLLEIERDIGREEFDAAMIAYYQIRKEWNDELLLPSG